MELNKEVIKAIIGEIGYLNPNLTSWELKYSSNPAGDEYKIFVNNEDESDNFDLYIYIGQLVDDFDSAHGQIIIELEVKYDSSAEPITAYKVFEGDRSKVVRYEPLK